MMTDSLELQLVRAYRRYLEHLQGKHNQKSHGNKYGSAGAIKGNVQRLGGDKAALKSMAGRARKDKDFRHNVSEKSEVKKITRIFNAVRSGTPVTVIDPDTKKIIGHFVSTGEVQKNGFGNADKWKVRASHLGKDVWLSVDGITRGAAEGRYIIKKHKQVKTNTLPPHLQKIADKWQAKIDTGTAKPIIANKGFTITDVTPKGYGPNG